ncbi:MAG: hypothetical protein AOA65_1837 [Candidatus Bathyarchaeota archaeon BA1]|nr:MAG: hypothetical protein AOA65_1837 [Candidatus Bathyarchaeota archaeon BA1]
MSREAPVGLVIAEKFLGLLIILVGALLVYVTYTNPPTGPVSPFSGVFMAVGFALIALGIFLILAKAE